MSTQKSGLQKLGCRISEAAADLSAHPYAQIALILICGAWFLSALSVNVLTAILSILAITLTQMVLNRQQEREADAHRRDVALHAKLDELLVASRRARDELAGVEVLEEEQIEAIRDGNGTVARLSAARKARNAGQSGEAAQAAGERPSSSMKASKASS